MATTTSLLSTRHIRASSSSSINTFLFYIHPHLSLYTNHGELQVIGASNDILCAFDAHASSTKAMPSTLHSTATSRCQSPCLLYHSLYDAR